MAGYIINYNGYTVQDGNNSVIDFLDGISRVETRVAQDYITGGHGGIIWERKLGMRVITLRGALFYDSFTDYYTGRASFQDAFFLTNVINTLTITRPDGVTKSIQAKVIDIPQFNESKGEIMECTYEVVLKCEDPFFTDTSITSGTITPGISGGTPVPMPVPSPVGGVGQSLTIFNTGDIDNYPSFAITGNITNAQVTNQTTGESFTIATNIPAGSTLNVFYNATGLYVTLGNSNYMQYLSGTVFKLVQGANKIVFNGSSFDANASLTVSFSNQYISL